MIDISILTIFLIIAIIIFNYYYIGKRLAKVTRRRIILIAVLETIFIISFIFLIIPTIRSFADAYYNNNEPFDDKDAYGYYNSTSGEITILVKEGTYRYYVVNSHELCHKDNNYKPMIKNLNNGIIIFLDEFECQIKGYLFGTWDYVFKE